MVLYNKKTRDLASMKLLLYFAVFVLFAFSVAALPSNFTISGLMYNSTSGVPLNGTHSVTFQAHSLSSGGSVASQELISTNFFNGVYNVIYSNLSPLSVNQTYFWTASVAGGSATSPRITETPVRTSFWADNASRALVVDCGGVEDAAADLCLILDLSSNVSNLQLMAFGNSTLISNLQDQLDGNETRIDTLEANLTDQITKLIANYTFVQDVNTSLSSRIDNLNTNQFENAITVVGADSGSNFTANHNMSAINITGGENATVRSSGNKFIVDVVLEQLRWDKLTNFPSACTSSQTITGIAATITCAAISITVSQISDFDEGVFNTQGGNNTVFNESIGRIDDTLAVQYNGTGNITGNITGFAANVSQANSVQLTDLLHACQDGEVAKVESGVFSCGQDASGGGGGGDSCLVAANNYLYINSTACTAAGVNLSGLSLIGQINTSVINVSNLLGVGRYVLSTADSGDDFQIATPDGANVLKIDGSSEDVIFQGSSTTLVIGASTVADSAYSLIVRGNANISEINSSLFCARGGCQAVIWNSTNPFNVGDLDDGTQQNITVTASGGALDFVVAPIINFVSGAITNIPAGLLDGDDLGSAFYIFRTSSGPTITASSNESFVRFTSQDGKLNVSANSTDILINNSVTDTDTTRSDEEIEDLAGEMVTGNTETGISVTYQDGDGTLDFVVSATDSEVANDITLDGGTVGSNTLSSGATFTGNMVLTGILNNTGINTTIVVLHNGTNLGFAWVNASGCVFIQGTRDGGTGVAC